jgi:hypothetical protein
VVADDPDGGLGGEPFEALSPLALGIDRRELHRRALLYDAVGVISSLRPLTVRTLLRRGADAVLLLDTDTFALGPLADLAETARDAGVLLTPHAHEPLPGEPGAWPEEEFLRSGAFNGGVLGVGRRGEPFLDWLAERTRRDCLHAPERSLFYGQTWLDLVPALFPHRVLRDRGVNAMIHNLRGDDVEWTAAGPTLGGAPLRLFHFTGFDPERPDWLCRYYPNAEEASTRGRPGLSRLCAAYAERLRAGGWPARSDWGFAALPGGPAVDAAMRSAYREALLRAERDGGREPPDPFGRAPAFLDWLRAPPSGLPGPPVSRYLLALYSLREDLRAVFPEVPGSDSGRLIEWAATKRSADGAGEVPSDLATVRPPGRVRRLISGLRHPP